MEMVSKAYKLSFARECLVFLFVKIKEFDSRNDTRFENKICSMISHGILVREMG